MATSPHDPEFTVVVATYARGDEIEPTLASVARQSNPDFEVLVVSDGPPAPGLAETVGRFDHRFRIEVLPTRSRSQSGPNNLGWSIARGRYVAYLGHDDIWDPGHLEHLSAGFDENPDVSFVVSGCIYFGPPGTDDDHTWVTGIFDPADQQAARVNFFPPSSVAHRRVLPSEVPRWPDATTSRRPVDAAFMSDAAAAGCSFTSTGLVTVFKFASSQRYLSYLVPDDVEQRQMLSIVEDQPAKERLVDEKTAVAKAQGTYMHLRHSPYAEAEPGLVLQRFEHARGTEAVPIEPLRDSAWIPPGADPRAYDWFAPEVGYEPRWRWSGPNSNPRLLVPFSHDDPVHVGVHVLRFAADDVRTSLEVTVDRALTSSTIVPDVDTGGFVIWFRARLHAHRPTVVELRTDRSVAVRDSMPGSTDERRVGIALLGIELETEAARQLRAGSVGTDATGNPYLSRARAVHQMAVARDQLEAVTVELAHARQQVEQTAEQLARAQQLLDATAQQLLAVTGSRIWRFTAGYRSVRNRGRSE